jgi:hypothetical protein
MTAKKQIEHRHPLLHQDRYVAMDPPKIHQKPYQAPTAQLNLPQHKPHPRSLACPIQPQQAKSPNKGHLRNEILKNLSCQYA